MLYTISKTLVEMQLITEQEEENFKEQIAPSNGLEFPILQTAF